ncbi:hypothetical protein CIHG_03248 [Coccidioides immitis H538.4]|uniref:Uncharacterized protein n=1 Tax=Coccidioides immitis H538.4 TaxID=396776 RepID=A0A0J8RLF8_COCIT|nr:hypothetical protein CIHG_03248 [Coccidioides immitis H538.4]
MKIDFEEIRNKEMAFHRLIPQLGILRAPEPQRKLRKATRSPWDPVRPYFGKEGTSRAGRSVDRRVSTLAIPPSASGRRLGFQCSKPETDALPHATESLLIHLGDAPSVGSEPRLWRNIAPRSRDPYRLPRQPFRTLSINSSSIKTQHPARLHKDIPASPHTNWRLEEIP